MKENVSITADDVGYYYAKMRRCHNGSTEEKGFKAET